MTTKIRTGLLLGFTAMLAMATPGCIVETTSGPKGNCADNRYFQVYWSVAQNASTNPYTCTQTPPFSNVVLTTNNGTFVVGKECRATSYMGFVFDFAGSTNEGIPTGTYVTQADLVATDGVTSLSTAPGPGTQYQVPSCDPLTVAFTFDLE